MKFLPAEMIQKKKRGGVHTQVEIENWIQEFTRGTIPDYQMSAWAMAVCFQGMTAPETAWLTLAMKKSGTSFNFSHLKAPRIDKHSTGGVGDKTSLIIGPILAAAEVYNPMIAGRGLGHTGGTLDKLESIPGFRINLTQKEFESNIEKHFFSLMGQTAEICPADRKLYALRDVTATVDSIPLICASIMSKKLAEDLTGLVLDVKYGNGAFMKSLAQAEMLARTLKETGEHNGVQVHALLTDMSVPLGCFAGNSLEIFECVEIMQGKSKLIAGTDMYESTRELSLQLAAHGLFLAKKTQTLKEAYALAKHLLETGAAMKAFEKMCEYQGPARLDQLPVADFKTTVTAQASGCVTSIQTEKLGLALIDLGAGRRKTDDKIDPSAGIEMCVRVGDRIEKGQPLLIAYCQKNTWSESLQSQLRDAFAISNDAAQGLPLIAQVIT